MLVYHGPLGKDFPVLWRTPLLLRLLPTCSWSAFFVLLFLFLGRFYLDHRVAIQDIDRCLVVEARENLPIGVTDI